VVSLAERRRCVTYLRNEYDISERRACQAMQMHRASYRYVGKQELVDEAYQEVVRLSQRYPYFGHRKIYDLMRADWRISRERVRLIRRREGLQCPTKRHKRKVLGPSTQWVNQARYPHHVWSYDFVFDATNDGRRLKCMTVVDEFTRECLTINMGRSLTSKDVIRTLKDLFARNGKPACLRSDNGPEMVAKAVQKWLQEHHVDTHYIDPGSPWQNAYCESFNSIFRTTCLDRWAFHSLTEARVVIKQWVEEYNQIRPHGSLKGISPAQFIEQWQKENSDQITEILTA